MSFMLALPKISLHGAGAIGDMVKLVAGKQWGKALIVTDGQLVKLGLLDSLFSALDEQQMAYQLFDDVFPNPTEALVQQGYAAYQAARCDYLIAFGGGSPIDTAKAIKILTANPGPSTAYSGVGKVKNAGVPLVAINTTAGTAAEMTSNAVIIDSERQVKEVIIDPNLIPDIAVDDASVMLDIPPAVTAATGMDALTHAIEAYVSTLHTVFTDPLALKAIHIVEKDLLRSFNGDMGCREEMHYGQCLAGMAFSNALLGIVHSMAHKTGAAFSTGHITHGLANAMYLPYVIAYNAKADGVAERYADIARTMGVVGDTTAELVEGLRAKIRSMNDAMGIPNTLKDFGIIEDEFKEKLDAIAANAVGDACTGSNPRPIDPATMAKLFTCIYYGTEVDF